MYCMPLCFSAVLDAAKRLERGKQCTVPKLRYSVEATFFHGPRSAEYRGTEVQKHHAPGAWCGQRAPHLDLNDLLPPDTSQPFHHPPRNLASVSTYSAVNDSCEDMDLADNISFIARIPAAPLYSTRYYDNSL
jgi:hypothetical protein